MDIVALFHTVQVQGRLRRQLQRTVALTDLFRFPTVRTLAQFLSGSCDDQSFERLTGGADARGATAPQAPARPAGKPRLGGALTGAAARQHW
jgi:hypothetical protein